MELIDRLMECVNADGAITIDNRLYEDCVSDYPYMVLPHLLRLKGADASMDEQQRQQLIGRLAMMLPERSILFSLVNSDTLDAFYPVQGGKSLDTVSTIDSFLSNYGSTSKVEERLIEQQIFNPTPEYASILAADFDANAEPQGDMSENDMRINDFINNRHSDLSVEQERAASEPIEDISKDVIEPIEEYEEATLSESLAKIYIKQGKYAKALEIITKISLTNSEKSVYFADQIRFLRKLIINEQFKA